jgi:hypothetical protein
MPLLRSQAPQDAVELCRRLHQLFPVFGEHLAGEYFVAGNEFLADKMFTPHAVCSAFTDCYLTSIPDYATPEVRELFEMVEVIAAADPADTDPLANALFTCFLENISCTAAGDAGLPFMGPRSRRFFDGWHTWPLPPRERKEQ